MATDLFGTDSDSPVEATLQGGAVGAMLGAVCDTVYNVLLQMINFVDKAQASLNAFFANLEKQLINLHALTPMDELRQYGGEALALAKSILPYNLIDEVQRFVDLVNKCNFLGTVSFGNPLQFLITIGEALINFVYGVIMAAFSIVPEINLAIAIHLLQLLIIKLKLPKLCDQVWKAIGCLQQCCAMVTFPMDISALAQRFTASLEALFLNNDADFNFESFIKSVGISVPGMTSAEAVAALLDGTTYVEKNLCAFVDVTTAATVSGMEDILKAMDFSNLLKLDPFPTTMGY